jgi:hypothetical protein
MATYPTLFWEQPAESVTDGIAAASGRDHRETHRVPAYLRRDRSGDCPTH